jgi:glucosamine--fructose-6-phosphate aminotransferase (isomerizing)
MCGIFGYLGRRNAGVICIEGLKALEYRGYDSAGIAGVSQGRIESIKQVGHLSELEKDLHTLSSTFESTIAHTRWATHGKASIDNAHPHFDEKKSLAIVHNGIIENHRQIKLELIAEGVSFYSDTDSEVIAKLISYFYKGDLVQATNQALKKLKGLWAIACIHKDHPQQIVVASHDTPLAVSVGDDETFISSDANAFSEQTKRLFFIKSHQIALLKPGSIETFDETLTSIPPVEELFEPQVINLSKMGFDHFMQKEIFEQPFTLDATLKNRIKGGLIHLDELNTLKPFIQKTERIIFIGCGTSWHAGLQAALLCQKVTGLPSSSVIASEMRYDEVSYSVSTLFIAISQSGETMDTLSCVRDLRHKGHTVLALTNVPHSSLEKVCSQTLHLRAGAEISVCSTKAFTSQLTLASLVVLKIAEIKDIPLDPLLLQEFENLPKLAHEVLAQKQTLKTVAQDIAHFEKFYFLGRQDMYITALESALKLKEISYAQATAYPAGEMKHGPIALIQEDLLTIALLGHCKTLDKIYSNLMEVHSRSGPLVIFAPKNAPDMSHLSDHIIHLPECHDSLAPIPYAIACQLLAYYVASYKNCPIDKPKNLAKSVTVE